VRAPDEVRPKAMTGGPLPPDYRSTTFRPMCALAGTSQRRNGAGQMRYAHHALIGGFLKSAIRQKSVYLALETLDATIDFLLVPTDRFTVHGNALPFPMLASKHIKHE